MKHKRKLKIARKLVSKKERMGTVKPSIFSSEAWLNRRDKIRERVSRRIKLARERRKIRNQLLKQ